MKIAHISDLHFSKFSFNPLQFFSKQWIGNCNLLFNRSNHFLNTRPFSLIPIFQKIGITHVIISGDLTTTSTHHEYQIAQRFIQALKNLNICVYIIPGNHDHYTKRAEHTRRFYQYFPQHHSNNTSLKNNKIFTIPLEPLQWTLVLMDTSCATSLTASTGTFSEDIETELHQALKTIPNNHKVMLVNHFPFFDDDIPRRRLLRSKALKTSIEQFPNIQIYLHGHTHRLTIADLRANQLPLVLNSGSTGHKHGSWIQMDLENTHLDLTIHHWKENQWMPTNTHAFQWDNSHIWFPNGLPFKCTECGKCCSGDGFVKLDDADIQSIANALALTIKEFCEQYTINDSTHGRILKDHPHSLDCIFLKNKQCQIHAHKPKQCKAFPFWPSNLTTRKDWDSAGKDCEGINHPEAPTIALSEILKRITSDD